MNENQILILRDNAKQDLMAIKTLEDGLTHLNKLKTIEVWVKAEKKDAELQNIVAEQKLRTQRILGEFLKKTEKHKGGNPNLTGNKEESVETLEEIGLTKKQSSTFQQIANIPADDFERFISEKKEAVSSAVSELTTAGALRFANKLNGHAETPWMDRQVAIYVHPKYYEMFVADCDVRNEKESERGGNIFKQYYNGLSAQEQNNLKIRYKEMMVEKAKDGKLKIKL